MLKMVNAYSIMVLFTFIRANEKIKIGVGWRLAAGKPKSCKGEFTHIAHLLSIGNGVGDEDSNSNSNSN